MNCPTCGLQHNDTADYCVRCGTNLQTRLTDPEAWKRALIDSALQEKPDTTLMGSSPYGGFMLRAGALLFDFIFILLFSSMTGMRLLTKADDPSFFAWTLPWLYYAGLESSALQATLGKRLLGLKVTDLNGKKISFARATGRYIAKLVSIMTLGFGFMLAGMSPKRQALHDMIAGCLVVKR